MIRLMELYPDHLNLNGDRGNLQVLQKRLTWAGLAAEIFTHRVGQPLPSTAPDFVLLGHGSPAAWRQIYGDMVRIAPMLQTWLAEGTQMLAVSSGFAALHGLLEGLSADVARVARVSKFEVAAHENIVAVGYKNSDLDLPDLVVDENFIGTLLHGPLLAKNEDLADVVISKLLDRHGIQMPVENTRRPRVSDFASQATELAKDLARE